MAKVHTLKNAREQDVYLAGFDAGKAEAQLEALQQRNELLAGMVSFDRLEEELLRVDAAKALLARALDALREGSTAFDAYLVDHIVEFVRE
jgi:hypothetical protein